MRPTILRSLVGFAHAGARAGRRCRVAIGLGWIVKSLSRGSLADLREAGEMPASATRDRPGVRRRAISLPVVVVRVSSRGRAASGPARYRPSCGLVASGGPSEATGSSLIVVVGHRLPFAPRPSSPRLLACAPGYQDCQAAALSIVQRSCRPWSAPKSAHARAGQRRRVPVAKTFPAASTCRSDLGEIGNARPSQSDPRSPEEDG